MVQITSKFKEQPIDEKTSISFRVDSPVFLVMSCNTQNKENKDTKHLFTGADGKIELIVLDPGHFHASLLQKFPQNQVNDTVLVFVSEGDELHQYLQSIDGYNQRVEDPTDWHEVVYAGSDYLEKMIEVKKGNVVVLAGNNAKKTDYILRSINAGFNLLSDKPMAINRRVLNYELPSMLLVKETSISMT